VRMMSAWARGGATTDRLWKPCKVSRRLESDGR
jgi:hypothetical protein